MPADNQSHAALSAEDQPTAGSGFSAARRVSSWVSCLRGRWSRRTLGLAALVLVAALGSAAVAVRGAGATSEGMPGEVDCTVTRCVALTFDDGPVPATADLLDVLDERGARATFFVIGGQVAKNPEVITRMVEGGHEIGNHTWSHADLTLLDPAGIADEIGRAADAVVAAGGPRPTLVRPPYGATNEVLAAVIGLPQVLWSLDTRDWAVRDTDAVVARVLERVGPGAIVLLHDIRPTTRAAVPVIVDALQARGYALVTVSEVLGPDLTAGAVYTAGPAMFEGASGRRG